MSKAVRQSQILKLISTRDFETQDELAAELRRAGLDVTQATVSRDIKELCLVKTLTSEGKYRYVVQPPVEGTLSTKELNVMREAVISVVPANNLVVFTTLDGCASAVGAALQQLDLPTLGILSDKCTVLAVCADSIDAADTVRRIRELL